MADTCEVPPPGWTCSREPGHDGPCAASESAWSDFGGVKYPEWSDDRRLAIAIFCDDLSDEFFERNGKPDQDELDTMFRTLYDLINVL